MTSLVLPVLLSCLPHDLPCANSCIEGKKCRLQLLNSLIFNHCWFVNPGVPYVNGLKNQNMAAVSIMSTAIAKMAPRGRCTSERVVGRERRTPEGERGVSSCG